MNLTKKEREEVTKVYDTWLNSYLTGDVETYDSFFDDRYHFIGSTGNEHFLDRRDTTEFFANTGDQFAGKTKIKNNTRTIEKFEGLIFVTEIFDTYFLIEGDWTYYGKFRFTSALKKNIEGWRFIYQHFSTPDTKAEEGETIGTQKIAAENLILKEAVRRRTIELEHKTRELEIESALERVRASAMAMHSSDDLSRVATVLFEQMKMLGGDLFAFGIVLCDKHKNKVEQWHSLKDGGMMPPFQVPVDLDYIHQFRFDQWKAGEKLFSIEIPEGYIARHFELMFEVPSVKEAMEEVEAKGMEVEIPAWEIDYGASFSYGYLLVSSLKPFHEDHIFPRFAKVFEQAYTRFLDLQKAEAQAREAVKQASLDRVRGQIASMRNTKDLQQITPLVWNELKTLEVPFFRCGIFIINEKEKNVHVYLTTPDGSSLAALHLAFDANDLTRNAVASWRKNNVYQEHWNREEFIAWMKEMMKLRQIRTEQDYQGAEAPPESLHLHFIPFAQGMLYIGNTEQLAEEKIDLVKSLAEAFSFAYARYQDFVVLEEAKVQVEKALSDLKSTQSQLIQSEKMASLGELTAGIAHEIQNPLNFVNNFAEVSIELIDEMKEELAVGSWQLAAEIVDDVKKNLEKINHHGKRADAIVKGMLQHSRTNSGVKEPTDINALADEYLRLSYHGLRAKDRSFNADFKTDFDPDLPKVNVIPQDIGRVLLNLINNAFYAVDERAKQKIVKTQYIAPQPDYTPTVAVSTKNLGDRIEISVKDNGNGIPDEIKDKIFQPFFTTKPTGEGTGLGLSMSYDIITKGHGGKLGLEMIRGEGSHFTIILPA